MRQRPDSKASTTTMEQPYPSKPRLIVRRMAERRKTIYLKGPPFFNKEGLILINRRSNEERRGKKPAGNAEICALLRQQLQSNPANGGNRD